MRQYTVKEIATLLKEGNPEKPLLDSLKRDGRSGVKKLLDSYYKRLERDEIERNRLLKMTEYELKVRRQGYSVIAGVDEAGRGPLAGPVVAAAVILPLDIIFYGLNDSKKLSPQKRETLYEQIKKEAVDSAVGVVEAGEIDIINIHQASLKAMRLALASMYLEAEFVLVDGFAIPELKTPQKALTGGDALSVSIAAASVLAKVTRDSIMLKLHGDYPQYGFDRHKGYGTDCHRRAIELYGPSPEHRRSFCLK